MDGKLKRWSAGIAWLQKQGFKVVDASGPNGTYQNLIDFDRRTLGKGAGRVTAQASGAGPRRCWWPAATCTRARTSPSTARPFTTAARASTTSEPGRCGEFSRRCRPSFIRYASPFDPLPAVTP